MLGLMAIRSELLRPRGRVATLEGHLFEMVSGEVRDRCRYCGISLEDSDGVTPCPKAP